MKLKTITVEGLFGVYDYEIPLNEGLTFIHSLNGMGKSTAMQLVNDLLNGNLEDVRTVPFKRMILTFDDSSVLYVENDNQELKLQMSRNGIEDVCVNDLSKISGCRYLGPERLYSTDEDGNITNTISAYVKELSDMLSNAMHDSDLPKVDAYDEKTTDAEVDRIFKDSLARIDFINQAGISPGYPSGLRIPPTRYDISQHPAEYRRLARSLALWCDRYYRLAESAVVFKDILNSIFDNKYVTYNQSGYPEIHMKTSEISIPLEKLSSGEKNVFIMFYFLLFKASDESIVIIDEPEISLHVTWQQKLGKLFSDVARLRDLTIIVTTHAPAIIHDDWDKAVELTNSKVRSC